MRQIKASEVKPGMRVRFEMDGWHVEGTVSRVEPVTIGLDFYSTQGVEMTLDEDTLVTVLAEAQPEAPAAFGACVETPHWTDEHGCNRFVWDNLWWRCGRDDGYMWEALTAGGAVKVISPDPFARSEEAPERTPDAPEVPERIEEWPEDDTALRPYPWRDRDGDTWKWIASASEWKCYNAVGNCVDSGRRPFYGPWTRVTDA